jgi:hypothetical protein
LSKIDLEITDNLSFEDGDCAVIIKEDGSIGRGDDAGHEQEDFRVRRIQETTGCAGSSTTRFT